MGKKKRRTDHDDVIRVPSKKGKETSKPRKQQKKFQPPPQTRQIEDSEETPLNPYDELLATMKGDKTNAEAVSSSDSDNGNDEKDEKVLNDEGFLDYDNVDEMNDAVSSDSEAEQDGTDTSPVANDPFRRHFLIDLEEGSVEKLSKKKENWVKTELTVDPVGRVSEMCCPLLPSGEQASTHYDVKKANVKKKLVTGLTLANQSNMDGDHIKNETQSFVYSVISQYKDLCFNERTPENAEDLRMVYCLHALNHMLKTRSRVVSHNTKIKLKKEVVDEYRDQGLTRPKVLILVPFRESALRVVNCMIKLLFGDGAQFVTNKKRFYDAFGSSHVVKSQGKKPADYDAVFAGNSDDHFRIGVGVAKKNLRLYVPFYSADVIITSPLGLRTVIGAEGDENRDFDFLSSIEMLIVDQADVFLMQNWEHIQHIMKHMHLQPTESHGVDFSRVRFWSLNGWAKYYRQTIVLSQIVAPEINSVLSSFCCNFAGEVHAMPSTFKGTISSIVAQMSQIFHKIQVSSFQESVEARMNFFVQKILPQYRESVMAQTLVFVPSYFDFVKIRNHFKKEEFNFLPICEYTKEKMIHRARTLFFSGRLHFVLYTERVHFYHRYRIRGTKHIIFYDLPVYPHFYSELCNFLVDSVQNNEHVTCTVLYTNYDALKLAAVVGSERAARMIHSDKAVHMFVTGES